jgi:hypothetical protein
MKTIVAILVLLVAVTVAAAPYSHNNLSVDGALGAAPDPLQTVLISDNYSHTVNVKGNLWYELIYNGSSTCYVRLMNTVTKANYVLEPVKAGANHSYLINTNTNFLNYSGCQGGTPPLNSILHLM